MMRQTLFKNADEISESVSDVSKGMGKSNIINLSSKSTALKSIESLPSYIQANVKRFFNGGSNQYSNFSIELLENNNYMIKMAKPGNITGSKAIYYKEIDTNGNTIRVFKETYDPNGNIVHIKNK